MSYIVAHQPVLHLVGDERRAAWQEAFRRVHEDRVADIMMFHIVGYAQVGPRVDFTPDISSNSELQVAKVRLKE